MKRRSVNDPNYNTFEEECWDAGYDSVINGADMSNCHFRFFATPAKTAAWERGRDAALEEENDGN